MAAWPRSIIYPAASVQAMSFILPLPSELSVPASGQVCLLRLRKNSSVAHFKRFHVAMRPLLHSKSFGLRSMTSVKKGELSTGLHAVENREQLQ